MTERAWLAAEQSDSDIEVDPVRANRTVLVTLDAPNVTRTKEKYTV